MPTSNGYSLTQKSADFCGLKFLTGPCKGLFWRYYFNAADGTCKQFMYGGCQGNQNNFRTPEECMKTCSDAVPTQAVIG
ncbi:Kunitz-type serine protease inhibitor 87 [Elysia marginata]|uniref:Kunitz-type serine protease inhibitor 87 n=1 Tax=Elysia marginata TaxID=1093978 RepID=A0AAV4GHM3_9GAST|nr:Kunitz-type serine protease inhibitor 87 [Elysia marginata]